MRSAIQTYIPIALHLLIWSALLLLPFLITSNGQTHSYVGSIPGSFFTIANVLHLAIFYFNAFVLYPYLLNRRSWWLYLVSLAVLLMVSFQLKYFIVATWFPEIWQNVTAPKFVFAPSFFFLIVSTLYRVVYDKIRFERDQKEKVAEQLSSELKFLRSQISPHFLFNVLTNLVSLARKKSDKLEPSLLRLADLMRYMLYDSQGKKVPLSNEIEYLKSYIELQKLRFESDVRIETVIEIGDIPQTYTLEPMLLIPFVENAFKHGVGWIEEPYIYITLSFNNGVVRFEVKNKIGKEDNDSKDTSSGIGLINVQSRLKLLYPDKHKLRITNQSNEFHVILTLQLT